MGSSEHDELYLRENAWPPSSPPPTSVGLGQIGSALRENYRFICGIAAVVFTATMVATLLSRMDFESTGRLYLGELAGAAQVQKEDLLRGEQGDVYSEIEIIRSRSLVTHAALKAGLNVIVAPDGWSAPRYWQWLLSLRDPSLLDVASRQLLATETTLSAQAQRSHRFTVEFVDSTKFRAIDDDGKVLANGQLGSPVRVQDVALNLIAGTAGSPRAGTRFEITVLPIDETVDSVLRELTVTASKSAPKAANGPEPVKVLTLSFPATRQDTPLRS